FDDGYGNGGPLSTISSSFTLLTASLAVYNQPYTETFSSGNTIAISSKVLTPAGANFTQGLVSATISENSRTITGPLSLNYDQTQGRWTGSYKVGPSDPSGTWLLTVTAQDVYGNSGQTVSSFNVNTPETQPWPTTTWTWLIPILAILGVGFGMLILKLRKGIHREVKLDLQAIHRKAEEVKSDDFLQSIQIQLKRRMDRMNQESQEKKSD
ncbi:hypothetical protein J2P12_05915, partial [Candidatus Bathyarchaeota archaeon]|nr:hypothetical protein [Candidatus Bathyarchaeota archaeon]